MATVSSESTVPTPESGLAPRPVEHPDTIQDAAATPDQEMPYRELGLKDEEYASIKELLGRRPTNAELAMYSVMWSEHCSYKSSKIHLKQFGAKVTPQMKEHLLVGMGENAGVVDIGDGWAVTYKVESHNHPSFVEPYQGAATGVGGIVRDIISMGARPVAVMDQLRFGAVDHPDTARVVHGVVAGVGGYGNCLGLPNIGGETEFDSSYQENPLVNALCVGVLRHDDIHLANASGAGNKVVLFGARTGGDGIGGASILASESFEDGMPAKRPSVQVGDPFMEKVLIECCLDLFAQDLVLGIQDLGAAGISCATSELASNGDGGMHVDLENVLLRDPTLTAGEILMSESQERMMAVVAPDKLEAFMEVIAKWDVEAAVIGEVNGSGRLTIDHFGERIVDVDPRTVAHEGPTYDRPYARPAWQDELNADTSARLARPSTAAELAEQVRAVVTSVNQASTSWVTSQYDRFVRGGTALAQPDDAGVIRVDEATGRGVAISTDANGRFTKLDPATGAAQALAESYRNVCTVGATPLAVTDCLNFGSPEDPDAMWQLVEAITGLADACQVMGIPVTGGNVSLYNSHGKVKGLIDSSINPTPVVGVLGVMDDVRRANPSGWFEEGLAVIALGATADELDGSAWTRVVHDHLGGLPPRVDLEAEMALGRVLLALSQADGPDGEKIVRAAHDVSNGGLIQTLVDSVLRHGMGASINLAGLEGRDEVDDFTALFSESGARAVVAVPEGAVAVVAAAAEAEGVAWTRLGTTGGELLTVVGSDLLSDGADGQPLALDLAELREGVEATLPALF
ncbi:phosphoribosylformylglycinamidine synthase subunit PurL [Actinomyces urogenitalis]|uniref:phosphoribosylformylglycinamidine synthase subunit PurL n=1 Tax=Actinomyces urogenitalis TaxID=103621 RepID=UPI00054FC9EF|nr:phosphoribosylformylglycinamidine synthase subunit PurL [Actinomyces urogenitalis]MBS6071918.1 phosphoribosylformylglycinamidine synthase subunit PurL [Actinomyces urogenitalis]MDK8238061.1 phosphoribosylformylglycinamidine synthase subunit PurL [Actinomyces urogenitalis]MDK8835273.1 phosphoribosylformylglycinamidine synthase subunit PurL [Actinomyces urogenitalis]MDU5874952.1 phosphoribosylformylglycinamidine synthase subunit PurL [Actinomyces urogenitalis]WOO95483.1 phosphoribosylformylgl